MPRLETPPQVESLREEWLYGAFGRAVKHDWDQGGLAWAIGTDRVAIAGRPGVTRELVEGHLDGLGWDLISIEFNGSGQATITASWR